MALQASMVKKYIYSYQPRKFYFVKNDILKTSNAFNVLKTHPQMMKSAQRLWNCC